MSQVQIADALVTVNNNPVAIIPNSLSFKEGLGEQKVRAASAGGGNVEQIYANDIETNFGMVKFSLPSTIANVEVVRAWKVNRNQNLVQIVATNADGTLSRTFSQASLLNDPEANLTSEGNIEVEFNSNPAV